MTSPEAWLRGPVEGVPDLLQPVAHALLQAREEARTLLQNFPAELLWNRPAGLASVGFHLQHVTGVVDRLFTYARGESLSREQQETLAREGQKPESRGGVDDLLDALDAQVERALDQLRELPPSSMTDARAVGRRQLPSTVIGLLFHAAEHVQRHVGQLLVTARVLQGGSNPDDSMIMNDSDDTSALPRSRSSSSRSRWSWLSLDGDTGMFRRMPMSMCPCGTSPLRPTDSFTDRFSPPNWLFAMREVERSQMHGPTSLGAPSRWFIRRWAIAGEKNKKVARPGDNASRQRRDGSTHGCDKCAALA